MPNDAIARIAVYHNDVVSALRLYFSNVPPSYKEQFFGDTPQEAAEKLSTLLKTRIEETDQRSALAVLTSLEAVFRWDYEYRREKKVKGDLFRAFRTIHKSGKRNVRLNEDILEAWKTNVAGSERLIGELRGAFEFRHWLAHGRHWVLKNRKYDFETLYDLADEVLRTFEFVSPN